MKDFKEFVVKLSMVILWMNTGILLGYLIGFKELSWVLLVVSIANLIYVMLPSED